MRTSQISQHGGLFLGSILLGVSPKVKAKVIMDGLTKKRVHFRKSAEKNSKSIGNIKDNQNQDIENQNKDQ